MLASLQGQLDMVGILVQTGGADINSKEHLGHTPFMAAASSGHYSLVQYYLNRQDVHFHVRNVLGQNVLHRCAFYGELRIIKIIVHKIGTSLLNQKDYNHDRPIHLAASKCNIRIIRYIIRKKGEDTLIKENKQKMTALDILEKVLNSVVHNERINQMQIRKYLSDKHSAPEQLVQLVEKKATG